MRTVYLNSVDPDEMLHYAASISSGSSLFVKVSFEGFPVYKELNRFLAIQYNFCQLSCLHMYFGSLY